MYLRTADFYSVHECRRCDHCKMWMRERKLVYCGKNGTTPEQLAIVSDKSADGCDRFELRELGSDRKVADMFLDDETGEPRR